VTGGKNNGTSGEVSVQPVKGGDALKLSADHILISTGRRPFT
jgi:dihydrolipoamide dehydrogenase